MTDVPEPTPLHAKPVPDGESADFTAYVSLGPLVERLDAPPDPLEAAFFGVRALLVEQEAKSYGLVYERRYEVDGQGRHVGDLEVRGGHQALTLFLVSLEAFDIGPLEVHERQPDGKPRHWVSTDLTGRNHP